MGIGAERGAVGKLRRAARYLYTAPPEPDASLGLRAEDFPEEVVEVFTDNWAAVSVFSAMGTQWRTGYSGPTGLDYNALSFVMQAHKVSETEAPLMFEDVRVMETAALEKIGELRGK